MVPLDTVILLVCATAFITTGHAQADCSGFLYSRDINMRLQCGIYKTLAANSLDCQKQCTATLNCFSINTYQSDNGTEICEYKLIKGSKDSFDVKSCLVMKSRSEHNELMVG